MSESVAAGIPVLMRTKAIERCLESLDGDFIDRAIVADNGETEERENLYNRDWEFELTVLNLEYNSGIGACRSAISEELTEDYLVVVDVDMIVPPASGLSRLHKALKYDSSLGAVSGVIVEGNRIRSGCSNLHEEKSLSGKKFVVHSIRNEPTVEWVESNLPIARFDKLTNAAMIRRECIKDYSWDSQFPMREHLDFYLGHYHQTDWEFAVCPSVIFDHQKQLYPEYREEFRNPTAQEYMRKEKETQKLYSKKWGYKGIEYGARPDWIDTKQDSFAEFLYRIATKHLPVSFILTLRSTVTALKK